MKLKVEVVKGFLSCATQLTLTWKIKLIKKKIHYMLDISLQHGQENYAAHSVPETTKTAC